MAVIWYRFRTEARRGWKAWLAVALLVGLGSGAVLALVSGARRTDSAISRYVEKAQPWDVQVSRGIPGVFDFAEVDLDEVLRLPGVADSSPISTLFVVARTPSGRIVSSEDVNFLGDSTGRLGTDLDRVKLLEGRLADPTDPGEVIVSFRAAEAAGLAIGDTISANFLGPAEQETLFADVGETELVVLERWSRGEQTHCVSSGSTPRPGSWSSPAPPTSASRRRGSLATRRPSCSTS